MSLEDIKQLLYPYDASPTECDGMTRIVNTILAREQIPHQTFIGSLQSQKPNQNQLIKPHLWVDLLGGLEGMRIDFRAQMWLGNTEDIPHGIFSPHSYPTVKYIGEPVSLKLLSEVEFYVLTMPLPSLK